MPIKICLDPGHGNKQNLGLNGYYESVGNLAACLLLKNELERYGFAVVLTRTKESENPDISTQRGQVAVKNGCQVFISWHSDANAKSSVRGVTVINSVKRPGSAALAQALAGAIATAMGTSLSPYGGSKNGVWQRTRAAGDDYYAVLRGATGSGSQVQHTFLIEHGFHTNPEDVDMLDKSHNRLAIVQAEAKALAEYFGLAATQPAPEESAEPETTEGGIFRLYTPVYAGQSIVPALAELAALKQTQPLAKLRLCADDKLRIYTPFATAGTLAAARQDTGADTLALWEETT